jgi:cold shock protein
MATGRVKWFDANKGFGFIINEHGQDVFVHYTSIRCDGFRALAEGQVVEYDEDVTAKGLSGKNVKVSQAAAEPETLSES